MDKGEWRRRLRTRKPVTRAESAAVTAAVAGWLASRSASSVLVYLPMVGEVDVTGAVDDRHRWFVTRTPPKDLRLTVHPWESPRERHRFGYEQPVEGSPVLDPAELDVVLTPGLGFDRTGTRLGWGKGYYDRLFADAGGVIAVGITIDRLVVGELLPVERHDRRMDLLATESGVGGLEDA